MKSRRCDSKLKTYTISVVRKAPTTFDEMVEECDCGDSCGCGGNCHCHDHEQEVNK